MMMDTIVFGGLFLLVGAFIIISMLFGDPGEREGRLLMTNEEARIHFKGICPYTSVACGWWECSECEVEKRERDWAHKIDEEEEG